MFMRGGPFLSHFPCKRFPFQPELAEGLIKRRWRFPALHFYDDLLVVIAGAEQVENYFFGLLIVTILFGRVVSQIADHFLSFE